MNQTTPAVKNIIIINILMFAAMYVFSHSLGYDLNGLLGLHYVRASDFGVWQFVTFLFMHGGLSHLFFNMFALWMFGSLIERSIGMRRFLIYYMATGIGSGIMQELVQAFQVSSFTDAVNVVLNDPRVETIQAFINSQQPPTIEAATSLQAFIKEYNGIIGSDASGAETMARSYFCEYQQMWIDAHVTIGASGAVFGLLLAAAMLFPDMTLMLMLPPVQLKMKWYVLIYGVIELFCGVANFQSDNVAHWAHLGGMAFGYIILRRWMNRDWR